MKKDKVKNKRLASTKFKIIINNYSPIKLLRRLQVQKVTNGVNKMYVHIL